ncbi:MAG: SOS response-associated peptidase [Streptosporangiaceae bacterium]|jgi:putative SOS response-associated peptidase YedK
MCGRFVSARQRQELIDEFLVERDQVVRDVAPDYNVAPTDPIYAVLGQCRELRLVRWGLVPSWAKDRSGGARLINARAETVAVKPSFRSAFARRRCLIPADGYYEWRPLGGREHGRPRKQPYYIHRADGQGMALAGIYEFWRDAALPDDHPAAWLWTAAIITTQATDHMGWVHDRMPMVVSPVHWDEWLDPATGDTDSLLKTITPAASDDLETRPVSTAVNSVANDGPDLITGITALAAGGEPGDILAADSGPGEA